MKFTNYKNMMIAVTGLIRNGWSLYRMELDGAEITTIQLIQENLDLIYVLEHHKHRETYDNSPLTAFVRSRGIKPLARYEREETLAFPGDLENSNIS